MVKKKTEWVNASDVGSAKFCPKAFELRHAGAQHSSEAEARMNRGNKAHEAETKKVFGKGKSQDQRCYIATYAFGQDHQVTQSLRDYRDNILLRKNTGRIAVYFYYKISPLIIKIAGKNTAFNRLTKIIVQKVADSVAQENKNNV